LYRPAPPEVPEGLVALWNFDEGSGTTAADSSGNGHDGTISGATWASPGAEGTGFCLDFDGQGTNRVSVGTFDVTGNAISIACWYKADNLDTPGNDPRLISKAIGGSSEEHWFMVSSSREGSTKVLRFRLKTDGTTGELKADTATGNIELDVWTHAAAVWDGATMRLYKNGVEVGSTAKGGTLSTNPDAKVSIGNQPEGTGDRPWDGLIDDVRLYNVALSEAQIQELAAPPVNLVQNGTFDDDSAWTVIEHTVPAVTNIDLAYSDDAPANGEAPCLRVSADGVAVSRPLIYQKLTLTAGATYQVTAAIKIVNFYGPASYPPGPWFQIYMNDAEPDPPADATFDWNPSTKLLNIAPWSNCFIGNSFEEMIGADGLLEELSGCSDIGDNTGLYVPPGDPGTDVDIWLVIKPGMWASSDVVGGYDVLFDNVGVYPVE